MPWNISVNARDKMFGKKKPNSELDEIRRKNDQQAALLDAINRSMAVIEFQTDGTIVSANENFLSTVGYSLDEVKGKQHRIFCEQTYANSEEYKQFWRDLNKGEFINGRFDRRHKDGSVIWLEASYNPIYDSHGVVTGIVKFASNITDRVEQDMERNSFISAISRSMAVIEFNSDGTIITANDNFLQATGYGLSDIQGQHHRMFCDPEETAKPAYQEFWDSLAQGQFFSGQFQRFNSKGEVIWLEASYNPVLDAENKVKKIVKIAADITKQVENNQAESEAAQMAYNIAQETDVSARDGSSVVDDAVRVIGKCVEENRSAAEHIQSLNDQSEHIAAIVSTISSIADQTNLLALNAAIEAARAGDQGRGFAVVADEVRQLAARTSSSTSEIAEVVNTNRDLAKVAVSSMETSVQQAEEGASLANQVGEKIRSIQDQSQQVVSAIGQLSSTLEDTK